MNPLLEWAERNEAKLQITIHNSLVTIHVSKRPGIPERVVRGLGEDWPQMVREITGGGSNVTVS